MIKIGELFEIELFERAIYIKIGKRDFFIGRL